MDDQEMFKPLKDFSAAEVAPQGGTVRALPSDLTEREEIDLLYQVETYMSVTDKHSQTHPAAAAEEARIYSLVNGLIAKRFSDIGAAVRGEAVVDIAEVDKHLEAVLRAGGSSMRYFSMPKAVSDMRDAIIEAMRSNAVQVSARAADAPSEPSVRRHDAYKLASRLQSFADRLCNDQTIGTRYEGDEADLRTAIHFIRSSGRAADALDSQPGTDEPTDREALIACLGDDAATLSHLNPDDEMAQTMREAIAMLESDEVVIATLGMASSQPTDGGVRK